ncbi:hypothetical protein [Planomonospora algeriensis]
MIPEIVEIAVVTAGLGLPVAFAGLGAMHLLRERSIGTMLAVLAAVPVVVTVAGVAAITMRMIIEGGSRDIVLSVVVIGGLVGLGVAAVLARRVVAASRRLVGAVHDVSESGEFTPPRGLPAELARSPPPSTRPTGGSASAASASARWRAPAASSSPGSATTCAPRWPGCAPWPRPWRTAWSPTRRR